MDDYTCGKLKVGDKGQRYQVCCHENDGIKIIQIGFTDRENGEPFKSMVEKRPGWGRPFTIDRQDNNKMKYL